MAVYNLLNNMVKAVVCLALVAPVFFGVRNKWIAGEWFYFFHYILEAPAVTFLTRFPKNTRFCAPHRLQISCLFVVFLGSL